MEESWDRDGGGRARPGDRGISRNLAGWVVEGDEY